MSLHVEVSVSPSLALDYENIYVDVYDDPDRHPIAMKATRILHNNPKQTAANLRHLADWLDEQVKYNP